MLLFLPGWDEAKASEFPEPGFVVNFDFIRNASDGLDLIKIAQKAGAKVINMVPPAHVWDDPVSLAALNAILQEIAHRNMDVIFTRIDASQLPDRKGNRITYLYDRILKDRGRFPNGKPTPEYFCTTVGKDDYARWMEEEIRFYAEHYGKLPNLMGINLGPFSEPFSAERCGFLDFMDESQRYEIIQYTKYAKYWWHRWLLANYHDMDTLNYEFASTFDSFESVPLPLNEKDDRFGRSDLAYFDFVRSLNDWFVERYTRCRSIWHEASGRDDVPFILQFSGCLAEKIILGRPGYTGFDLPGWIAMADAVGLSLYTNSGYPDMGHATISATVNLVAVAHDMGKKIFVLESGNEAPNVTLDPVEVAFFGSIGRKLLPQTYIYEFLKDKFNETYKQNPGKVVTADGRIRHQAFKAVQELFHDIESHPQNMESPLIYVLFDSLSSRGNTDSGIRNAALFDLASSVPVRWIPAGYEVPLRPEIPILHMDGTVFPANERLSTLMSSVPDLKNSEERANWRQEVQKAISLK